LSHLKKPGDVPEDYYALLKQLREKVVGLRTLFMLSCSHTMKEELFAIGTT
jgi:hypothetical protein